MGMVLSDNEDVFELLRVRRGDLRLLKSVKVRALKVGKDSDSSDWSDNRDDLRRLTANFIPKISKSKSTKVARVGKIGGEHVRDESFGVMDMNRLLNCKDVDTNERRSGNDD